MSNEPSALNFSGSLADGVAVDRVRNKVAVLIVGSERPKGAHRRKDGFVEVHPIAHGAAEELSRAVRATVPIDGVFGGIRTYRKTRNGGSRHVVCAIASDVFVEPCPARLGGSSCG